MDEFFVGRMTTKGQITVPAELRKYLQISEGDYLMFERKGSKIELKKIVPPNDFKEFARPIRERFQREGITAEDVEAAIDWARGNKG